MVTNGNMDFIVFGDQTAELRSFLPTLLRRGKQSPVLDIFLKQALIALQQERSSLSYHEQKRIPTFSSLIELITEYYQRDARLPCLESSMTCLAQLGHFIE